MKRFVFVTQELSPFVPGGAGTVIAGLAAALGRDHQVVVIIATPSRISARGAGYEIVPVVVPEPDGSLGWFVDRSRSIADVLAAVVAGGRPDLVEFTDFEAIGFWALLHRIDLGLESVRMGVRLHGPIGAIAAAVGAAPHPWEELDVLERSVFSMSDVVLVPSTAMAEWVAARYAIGHDRVVVAPPIVPEVTQRKWVPSETPSFAAYGRLAEQKGVDILVRAMLPLFRENPVRLILIGPDGWSAVENRPMSEVLKGLVPGRFAGRVEMLGPMNRERALEALASAWAVVVPSRFETFCLGAHEARRAGLPLVVPDIPAFAPFRDAFLVYDGSVADITGMLRGILQDRSIAAGAAARLPPDLGDATAAYLGAL